MAHTMPAPGKPSQDRTAVVTGAAGGLGQAIVYRLADQGWNVVAVDIAGTSRSLDVRDPEACRQLARDVQPDLWVNNAAVLGAGDAATQGDDVVERVVHTNLLGVMNGTRAALEVMRERGGGRGAGHIVNVGSLASWVPVPGEAVYAATKAGVLSYTLALVAELKSQGIDGVRLSVVCPDGMSTPMLTDIADEPGIALSFTGLRLTKPETVAARITTLLDQPKLIASIPRWRGAQVRVLGAVPELSLQLAGLFQKVGQVNQKRWAKKLNK
jgi:short-subunit dehydrogenase